MNHFEKADYISQLIPGYQYLCSSNTDITSYSHLLNHGYGCSAGSIMEVTAAGSNGIKANDIYFTQHHKKPEQLEQVFGKCRLVSGSLNEMQMIDDIASKHLDSAHLEVIGIHVIPDDYNDGNTHGFPVSELVRLASSFRKLRHLSIRGCFIEGPVSSLQGNDMQRHFRLCYETAKQVSTAIPCGMSYVCFGACTDAVSRISAQQKESLPDICKAAEIVLHQNDTAFYAKLLML